MINFNNVCYSVLDGQNTKYILKNITFTLPQQGLIALIGPSGSGKTTILNLICKTIKKTSGSIEFLNINYDDNIENNIDNLRKDYISIVFQDLSLFGDLTLYENVEIACKIKGQNIDKILFDEYLKMLHLENLKDEKVLNISRGEAQRVAILRAIMTKPRLIILDEPTSSLDKENSIIVMDFLKKISDNTLILFSSHDIDLVNKYTSMHLKLEYGEIVENTIINSCECKKDEIVFNKNKIDVNYLKKKIFHSQRLKYIFTSIFLTVSLVLFLIPFTNLTYNEYSYTYKTYSKLNYDTYLIQNEGSIISFDKTFQNDYPNLETNTIYYDYLMNSTLVDIGKNVVIDESLNDYDVIITDYTFEQIKSQIKDNKIDYGHYTFNIKEVKKTNYSWYKNLSSESKNFYSMYVDYYYYYNNVYMNQNTFKFVYEALNGYKLIKINNDYKTFKSFSVDIKNQSISINGSNSHYLGGSTSLEKNEVIVSSDIARLLLNEDLSSASEYIGKIIEILGKNYTIKDITTTATSVILSDEEYYDLSWDFKNFYYSNKLVSFKITNKEEFIKLLKDINDSDYSLFTPFSNELEFCKSEIESMRFISKYILAIAIVLFAISSIYLSYILIHQNKKRLGVVRALGLSKSNLYKILIIKISQIIGISIILSLILYLIYYFRVNINILNQTSFSFFPVRFEYLGISLYLLFVIIFIFLIFILMIHMYNKKDIKDSIVE